MVVIAPRRLTLDHLAVVGALLGTEGAEQHHAGVVDQHVGAAEFAVHALRGGHERVAVGDVGSDGDGAVAKLVSERLDAVDAPRQQRHAVAVGGQGTGGGGADARRGAGDDRDAAVGRVHAHGVLLVSNAAGGEPGDPLEVVVVEEQCAAGVESGDAGHLLVGELGILPSRRPVAAEAAHPRDVATPGMSLRAGG